MPWLSPAEWDALALSARVALVATVLSLPLGLAVAWLLERCRAPGLAALDVAVQLPMVVPPVVPGYLLLLGFGTQGPVGGWLEQHFGIVLAFDWKGAVLASAVMAFPLVVQPIRLALRLIDPRLEQAAGTLGARPFRVFATVTLPLAVPGLLAAAVLGFSRSLGEFGATMAFVGNIPGQTRTLPLAIYALTHQPGGEAAAMRLCLLSIGLAVLALVGARVLTRRAERALGFAAHGGPRARV